MRGVYQFHLAVERSLVKTTSPSLKETRMGLLLWRYAEAGLIVVEGRKITITDVEKLRGYDL